MVLEGLTYNVSAPLPDKLQVDEENNNNIIIIIIIIIISCSSTIITSIATSTTAKLVQPINNKSEIIKFRD